MTTTNVDLRQHIRDMLAHCSEFERNELYKNVKQFAHDFGYPTYIIELKPEAATFSAHDPTLQKASTMALVMPNLVHLFLRFDDGVARCKEKLDLDKAGLSNESEQEDALTEVGLLLIANGNRQDAAFWLDATIKIADSYHLIEAGLGKQVERLKTENTELRERMAKLRADLTKCEEERNGLRDLRNAQTRSQIGDVVETGS